MRPVRAPVASGPAETNGGEGAGGGEGQAANAPGINGNGPPERTYLGTRT